MEHLTTEDFFKILKERGYTIQIEKGFAKIHDGTYYNTVARLKLLAMVSLTERFHMRMYISDGELFQLVGAYSSTPTNKREPEKHYAIMLPEEFMERCLIYDRFAKYFFAPFDQFQHYQSKFTTSEIQGLPKLIREALEAGFLVKKEVKNERI